MKTTKVLAILVWALGLAGEVAYADFVFGTPTNLGSTVNSSSYDDCPEISADGLELYFHSIRPGGQGEGDIWMSTRTSKQEIKSKMPWRYIAQAVCAHRRQKEERKV